MTDIPAAQGSGGARTRHLVRAEHSRPHRRGHRPAGSRARRPRRRAGVVVTGVPGCHPSDGARRADDQGGSSAPGHPRGHRQDEGHAGAHPDASPPGGRHDMSRWHAPEAALRDWVDGRASTPTSASIEAHLIACDDCRARDGANKAGATPPNHRSGSEHAFSTFLRRSCYSPSTTRGRLRWRRSARRPRLSGYARMRPGVPVHGRRRPGTRSPTCFRTASWRPKSACR